ncbi:hypothetical protein GOBAR_AA13772 [Gossypium barbadense]|uniref:Uncharacterized protein n=1 Tax=Gossypium barbadense TaxID=3634 RepID=A0A2P5XU38_GOSBA|nr:hypothetical protein GOBAR_AA13772 [Gossypium barbadense]
MLELQLEVVDPQSLLKEKEAIEEKLRLAREDVMKLKTELQRKVDLLRDRLSESSVSNNINHALEVHQHKRDVPFSTLGPLKANERKDLNCAVTDQNLDVWANSPASFLMPCAITIISTYLQVRKLLRESYALAFSNVLASKRKLQGNKQFKIWKNWREEEKNLNKCCWQKGYERMWVIKSNGERDIMSLLCASVFSLREARNLTSRMVQLKDASLHLCVVVF